MNSDVQPVSVVFQDTASAVGQRILTLNRAHIPGTEADSLKVSDASRVVFLPRHDVQGYTSKQKSRSGCDCPASNISADLSKHTTQVGAFAA